ncbi:MULTISPECIES: PLP-dependent aminotransferase family protein [Lysinibacillus]|uniref:PLP-dependent aminotransferase family protein n=1 Tax=Lysinibacillus fusiformis TaxID=28031 RepID=A0A2I0UWM4_9BACI|nr:MULTISPECIES: PLP-dependent aminotransferase family protein [Lysinibacillus]KUF35174.1 GntR family transcriptional regulator [Lysinibacillus sp. F5]MEE3808048.1 PLP-dependent aminotransferase family protein [Lysinibacillus fusiformis]PKU50480.1 PLP-dependent aminotransferase family protein [Lysinibacillus fusiformis]SCY84575.1 transcriptional regulator, GntR family [Lysinibacillus sp. SG9]SDB36806.1 transcriptional regulator, GntR family [Lysinibacillus sp. TC-37]
MLKYEWIYSQLLTQIQAGTLQSGAKLPSIRQLSQQFSCSKSTILTALKKLEDQHLIYVLPKSGYYVVDHQLPLQPQERDHIDFATSSPSWNAFPYQDFQHCINKAIDTYQTDLFRYGTPKGLPSLITEAKKLLANYQVFAKEENIFITSGVQQSLTLLSIMPFPNGRSTILVEQPSYHLYMDYLKTYGVSAIGIKRTMDGIDLHELESIFSKHDIKFFYTMPRLHNPLGTSYSKKTKDLIRKLAYQYNVYIVEDDYLADFEQNSKIDPIYTDDTQQYVIYLKSFSKIMFPGLRIGLAVLPDVFTDTFQQYKNTTDIDSSMISQAALELYLKSGMFERYQKKVTEAYASRANSLQQSIATHLAQYQASIEVCMHSHIVLPRQVNTQKLIQHLMQHKIYLDTINRNYLDAFDHERILKLNVSNVEESKINVGIREIASALQSPSNYF